ncbi:S-adenosyl-L-methionine-dependent methyltransferase [Laetiporus sulphureus 93-53]|uniref:type I protein arginine methyltransferase n=1 Tax=Laetiporus sulphureus 93-53 TaxID=1314785 RepID=A0A165FEM1_9APHY|nr:S-adenosyl-L-methionine-dependent methyltransferase [Laetiporus sulphureus 93-53]KZT08853.1 S-adenosyl-L-methionine-dependent methyltransferase [Laetiporus sulphureus 93-53]
MSLHLPADQLHLSGSESDRTQSSEDEEEETWEDRVSDSMDNRPCKSLFDNEKTFTSVPEAVNHDKLVHGVDLNAICSRLALDPYQRIRLVNWIRKEKPAPSEVLALKGDESFFSSDEYLPPVLEDDPLLQTQSAAWSDYEDEQSPPTDLATAIRRIHILEKKVQQAKQDLAEYRTFSAFGEVLTDPVASSSTTHLGRPLRDDDSHYFQSYGENVCTATYAKFIMSSTELFRDAIVLDVGCGTGILSLFAARAGARRVFAVDASDIADKARQIVKDNKLDDVITVIRDKIEDIKLPDDVEHVDVIISEWMGYALLYEFMLDSVLRARDRFLDPEQGVMAPSQCRMTLGLCEASEVFKERVGFWSDIYGFDLSAMGNDVYEDATVDVVGPETMLSEPCMIKDLYLPNINPKQLDFSVPFKLVSIADRCTKVHALLVYFDVFFAEDGQPVPPDTEAYVVCEGDPVLAEVWPLGGRPHPSRRMSSGEGLRGKVRPKVTNFSTSPQSMPTHWKQTIFLLRDPITVHEGTTVHGTFKCRKSEGNSRELDVEIHYVVKAPADEQAIGDAVVQIYKVR